MLPNQKSTGDEKSVVGLKGSEYTLYVMYVEVTDILQKNKKQFIPHTGKVGKMGGNLFVLSDSVYFQFFVHNCDVFIV